MINISKEEIKKNVESWVSENISPSFLFRLYQEDAIITTIYNIVNQIEQNQIIEAPTGSGKSIICLISAGVLATYYDLKSYILCSDLYLWSQYEDFIIENNLDFGILKGQKDNYMCDANGEQLSMALCKIEGCSWKTVCNFNKMHEAGYECVDTCEYALNRRKAIKSKVCVMTYALWYAQMNIVEPDPHGYKDFMKRDVLFCDECHKIPELFSGFASPTIDPIKNFPAYVELFSYLKNNVSKEYWDSNMTPDEFHKKLMDIFEELWNSEDDYTTYTIFRKYADFISSALPNIDEYEKQLFLPSIGDTKNLTKEEKKIMSHINHIHNITCHITDFLRAIDETGVEYLVKNNNVSPKNADKSVTLMCAKEDFLCARYMFENTEYCVMLSATVGQKAAFDANCGILRTSSHKSSLIKIPSTFDFTYSPIYYFTKWNMGWGSIQENFPQVANVIFNLLRTYHNEQCGIIQTGSYKNAQQLYELCPKDLKHRLMCYNNKTEKETFLKALEGRTDAVIVGPSLVEGIDLPDDLCRFIMILKVPWPNLNDNLTKRKMKLFPKWYEDHTSKMIIQGIGRGNRHKDDWCISYILDNCFGRLYKHTYDEYSNEFNARLKVIM